MADIVLNQTEADSLFNMNKETKSDELIESLDTGGRLEILLISENKREDFVINFSRNTINLSKRNHHLRCRKIIGLARLDLDGPPHRNPDGDEIGPRHLHIYKEGYALRWAFDIPEGYFSDLDNAYITLIDFMVFCNVKKMPNITQGLFSSTGFYS